MGRASRLPWKSALAILTLAIVWNEWLSWWLTSMKWPTPNEQSFRILLVADPQLIGYVSEPTIPGPIIRADADRFLVNGFNYAMAATRPDAIFFLGDLFDEGELSPRDFARTLKRFNSIFKRDKSKLSLIISGDNDVGGELSRVDQVLEARFSREIPHNIPEPKMPFSFYQINVLESSKRHMKPISTISKPNRTFLLAHVPVLPRLTLEEHSWVLDPRPDIIFSAHDHRAEIHTFIANGLGSKPISPSSPDAEGRFGPNEAIIEVQVPTCSYRMGTLKTGYGVMELSNEMTRYRYYVLWLPSRYAQLFIYIVVLFLVISLSCRSCLKICCNRRRSAFTQLV